MKKLLAMLVALIMALSCTLALAEEAPQGVTITSELSIDCEAARNLLSSMVQDEDQVALIDSVAAILDSLKEQLVIADNGAQLDLFLKDSQVITLACEATETGLAVASTLFPSYVLTLSKDTVGQIMEQLTAQSDSNAENPEAMAAFQQIFEAANGYFEEYSQAVSSAVSFGDPEMGEFTVGDLSFNSHMPLNVDVQTIADASKKLVDQLENDENVQSGLKTLEGMGMKVSEEDEINLNLDELTNVAVTGDIYMNLDENGAQTGATYVLVQVVGGEEGQTSTTNVSVLVDEGTTYVSIELPENQTTLDITVVPDEAGVSVRVDANVQDAYFGGAFVLAIGEATTADIYIYVLDDENPLAVENITIEKGGELTMTVGDDKTELAIEDLMNDSEGELSSGLMMDVLFNGLGTVMSAASEALPDEVNALMSTFTGGAEG